MPTLKEVILTFILFIPIVIVLAYTVTGGFD